jgi:hypothetical protein
VDTCGIEGCGCASAVLLPWSPIEHFALCGPHAKAWLDSRVRGVLKDHPEFTDTDRRRVFKIWATTEAVGKDPNAALKHDFAGVWRAMHALH